MLRKAIRFWFNKNHHIVKKFMWEWGWEGRCSYAQIWQSVVVVGGQALQANGHSLIVLWWCEFRLWYCFNATAASCLKGRGLSDWGFLSIIDYFSVLKHLEETFIMILLCINNIELNLHRGWSSDVHPKQLRSYNRTLSTRCSDSTMLWSLLYSNLEHIALSE